MRFRFAAFPVASPLSSDAASWFRSLPAVLAVAALLLPGLGSAAHAESEMSFQAIEYQGESLIAADGRITERTPQMFVEFLREHSRSGLHSIVVLNSPGGIVLASMQLGTLLRKIGAQAVVGRFSSGAFGYSAGIAPGGCLSACVYTLIGARKRVIPPGSEVGIHRMFLTLDGADVSAYSTKQERAMAGTLRDLLSAYASKMGVSPALIARAESTPSHDMHILSQAEIKKWHLGVPNM